MTMPYTRETGKEFWFEFDNETLWDRTEEVADALARAYFQNGMNLDTLVDEFRVSFKRPDHPEHFAARIQAGADGFVDLARIQLHIIGRHLVDPADVQAAFEDFAQGVLLDDRRPPGFQVHKMDGDPSNWVGYHRWHAFMRAVQVLGEEPEQWEHLNRCLGLAWAIQTDVAPEDDVASPGMAAERLAAFRAAWMPLSIEELDRLFANHRFAAPSLEEVAALQAPQEGRFKRVQQILNEAAADGNPRHRQDGENLGRFWLKEHQELIGLSVYDQQLIADEGPDRGNRSALVKVLRGELESFPRMPMLPLPPVADEDIEFIRLWIDDGCPEV